MPQPQTCIWISDFTHGVNVHDTASVLSLSEEGVAFVCFIPSQGGVAIMYGSPSEGGVAYVHHR